MFKAPIKILHPLLTATQEGNYVGTESVGAIPYQGVVLAHSNESEWQSFRNNKNNEAMIDRICVVNVPYCLRTNEETAIYTKLLQSSDLSEAPCAPATLDMLSQFCVLSRLKEHENSNLFSKMRVYNGENLKDVDPKAKSMQEYRDAAGMDEGMNGVSTRFAFKILAETFNFDNEEVAADPVHLMYVLEQSIRRAQYPEATEKQYIEFIKSELAPRYAEFIGNEIQKAYLESYGDYGQNLFDRYVAYADAWVEDQDFKDSDTGELFDRKMLDQELSKIEKPAGIANPKDFRNEVVKFALRARAAHGGKNPSWTSYEKIREVIEKRMFTQVEDLLPVISFSTKGDKETEKKHNDFVERMVEPRLHRPPDPPPRRVVHARRQGGLIAMGVNVIDRRLNPSGKSLPNRQTVHPPGQGRDQGRGGPLDPRARAGRRRRARKWSTSRSRRIAEPRLRHASQGGDRDHVLPGNKEFVKGDTLPKPKSGEGGGGSEGSPDGEGEDDFRFTISADEYLSVLFEELELPDLAKAKLKDVETLALPPRRPHHRAARRPTSIWCARMRHSLSRRICLGPAQGRRRWRRWRPRSPSSRRSGDSGSDDARWRSRPGATACAAKMRRVAYIDPVDLRYNRFESTPQPTAQAVMFCLMDVSGSMTEDMKDLAKRFFLLLHLFLSRQYKHVDIVFIRHTSEAKEVDEETFFNSRETGGTVVSTALEEMRRDRRGALSGRRVEHLRRPGVRRRQLLQRQRAPACSC